MEIQTPTVLAVTDRCHYICVIYTSVSQPPGRAAARYRALASIIPGLEKFSWNLSFYFSAQFS